MPYYIKNAQLFCIFKKTHQKRKEKDNALPKRYTPNSHQATSKTPAVSSKIRYARPAKNEG
jgi:hypothetical protein